MVRPEPDQPFDKTDFGSERGVDARLGLGKIDLLRQTGTGRRPRWRWRRRAGLLLHLRRAAARRPHWPAGRRARLAALRAVPADRRMPRARPRRSSANPHCRCGRRPRDLVRRSARRADPRQWPRSIRHADRAPNRCKAIAASALGSRAMRHRRVRADPPRGQQFSATAAQTVPVAAFPNHDQDMKNWKGAIAAVDAFAPNMNAQSASHCIIAGREKRRTRPRQSARTRSHNSRSKVP